MYADPKLIRKHREPMYLNCYQKEKLERVAALTGGERAVIVREFFDRSLEEAIHKLECELAQGNVRVPLSALITA